MPRVWLAALLLHCGAQTSTQPTQTQPSATPDGKCATGKACYELRKQQPDRYIEHTKRWCELDPKDCGLATYEYWWAEVRPEARIVRWVALSHAPDNALLVRSKTTPWATFLWGVEPGGWEQSTAWRGQAVEMNMAQNVARWLCENGDTAGCAVQRVLADPASIEAACTTANEGCVQALDLLLRIKDMPKKQVANAVRSVCAARDCVAMLMFEDRGAASQHYLDAKAIPKLMADGCKRGFYSHCFAVANHWPALMAPTEALTFCKTYGSCKQLYPVFRSLAPKARAACEADDATNEHCLHAILGKDVACVRGTEELCPATQLKRFADFKPSAFDQPFTKMLARVRFHVSAPAERVSDPCRELPPHLQSLCADYKPHADKRITARERSIVACVQKLFDENTATNCTTTARYTTPVPTGPVPDATRPRETVSEDQECRRLTHPRNADSFDLDCDHCVGAGAEQRYEIQEECKQAAIGVTVGAFKQTVPR